MTRGPDPEIGLKDILHEFVVSPDPAFVPAEIADSLDVTTEGARHQMDNLADRGLLERKKPGQRTVIYWVTAKGRKRYARAAEES